MRGGISFRGRRFVRRRRVGRVHRRRRHDLRRGRFCTLLGRRLRRGLDRRGLDGAGRAARPCWNATATGAAFFAALAFLTDVLADFLAAAFDFLADFLDFLADFFADFLEPSSTDFLTLFLELSWPTSSKISSRISSPSEAFSWSFLLRLFILFSLSHRDPPVAADQSLTITVSPIIWSIDIAHRALQIVRFWSRANHPFSFGPAQF